ncbi:MAG TPA: hypothetical protein VFT36_05325 [Methylomirabilota bacterium]|nr:hypothetical protein [Methylomirabilota bacterium]
MRWLPALGVALAMAGALGACATSDAEFPPPQPPAAALRFKATAPGEFPVDVYFAAWRDGYVIYTAGVAPLYLIPDKQGGYMIQSLSEGTRWVVERPDGSGWNILSPSGPPVFLLKQEGGGYLLQPPGELPTLIVPD